MRKSSKIFYSATILNLVATFQTSLLVRVARKPNSYRHISLQIGGKH